MSRHLSIGALSALAAALCVAQAAHADIVTFNDIPFAGSHGMVPNDFYDGGLHFNDEAFAVMPLNLDPTPIGQTSNYLEAGADPLNPQSLVITHYTGQAPGNFDPVTPAGPDYADGAAFNLFYLKIGLGGGNTGLTDMVTITGDTPGCAGDTCPQMTIAVTDHFQLITLTGFTDLSSVTISQQVRSDGSKDIGWLGFDDLSYSAYNPDGPNPPSEMPSPVPAANAVPEPSAWALMILGFGGVGALMRRQRRADFVAA
jgi:hypothetical protein